MRRSAAALALALLLPLPGLAGQVVVKQGETLSDIAARYHVSVDRLLQLNGIQDPKALQVGTRLTVPGAPGSPSRAGGGGGGGGGATGGSGRGNYTVKAGETISEIADRYGISTNRLLELNGIRDAKGLQAGSRITVPTAGPAKPSRSASAGTAANPASRGPANYTVKAGETISEIADRYNLSTNQLLELNGIRDAKSLQAGSRITVPTAGPAKPSKSASAGSAMNPASRGPANYTVKAGETISEIADRYNLSTNQLLELNGIRDAKSLQAGSRITVPTVGPAKPGKPPVLPALSATQARALTHTVRPGDTLSDIANTYGVPIERITALNGLKDPDNLVAGTQLKLRNPPTPAKPAAKPASHPAAHTAARPTNKPTNKPASKPAAGSVATAKPPAAKQPSATTSVTNPATATQANPKPTQGGTKPAAEKPVSTATTGKPAEARPAETKPAQAKPAEAKPGVSKPVVTKPVVTKPVVTKPVVTKPVAEKPMAEKPAATQATSTQPVQQPTAKPETKPEAKPAGETAPKPETASKPEATVQPDVRPESRPEVKAEVNTRAETTSKPARGEGATGKPAKPDWRNFGPLQVDWANWQPMGGSYVAPGLNATGQSLYLAVNCGAKRINATGPSGAWKTWDLPSTDYEQQLVKDLCRDKGS